MEQPQSSTGALVARVALRVVLALTMMGALLFLPAGTLRFWPAWVFCGVLFVPMTFVASYLIRRDPALLERRMQMRETEPTQKRVIAISNLVFLVGFSIPGFDHRFGWSEVPTAVVLGANAVVFLSYLWVAWVLLTNSYASRTIRVEETQKVIDVGPYAFVRHPMYAGVVVMTLASPLALGSYWALLPLVVVPPLLAWRIRDEERVLREELPGYVDYCRRVRWRLAPGVW